MAINLYKNHQYQAAATLLGSALAQRQDGALWNDWAAAQAACGRRRLAELGFRQSLASELPCREAAGSLGLMLFEAGNFREALPLLIEAELSADQHTRPMLTRMVQQIREALGWCAPAPSRVAPRGLTIFLTGLSGAGKSTLAAALQQKLTGRAEQPVSLLDGDVVRQMLSSELGFSKQHRDINVRRIGFVSSLIARSGGIAICACIAPYDEARRQVRAMCKTEGNFLLVHVATPLEVCEQRDCKGLYARARAGELPGFTGLSDPYETPTDAEMSIDTSQMSVEEACEMILAVTDQRGYLADSVARQGDGILVGVA